MCERDELEQAAIRLLSIREHSRLELHRKLHARCEQPELLDQVIDSLEARGYQSDERFAEQFVGSRKSRGFGPLRIGRELQERGIDSALINIWIDPQDDEWRQLMKACSCRKFGDTMPKDFREQAKRARFLEYRGFSSEMIKQYLWCDIA